jgi:hypothetical protein
MRLAVRPNLPGQISLGVGDGLPLLHEYGVAHHGLDGLAQRLLCLLVRCARGKVHIAEAWTVTMTPRPLPTTCMGCKGPATRAAAWRRNPTDAG